MRRNGVSLAELAVSVALLGLVISFVLTLIPSSVVGLRHADAVQSAAAYAQDMIEQVRVNPALATPIEFDLDVEGGHYHLKREVNSVTSYGLVDVVVTMTDSANHTVTIGTRMPLATASP